MAAPGETAGTSGPPPPKQALGVLWRFQMPVAPNTPCAFDGGWIVTDSKGGVAALSAEGRLVWRTSFSNHCFECGAAVIGNQAFLASEKSGRVTALSVDTGAALWARATEACFRQSPLTGSVGGAAGPLACVAVRRAAFLPAGGRWRCGVEERADESLRRWRGRRCGVSFSRTVTAMARSTCSIRRRVWRGVR